MRRSRYDRGYDSRRRENDASWGGLRRELIALAFMIVFIPCVPLILKNTSIFSKPFEPLVNQTLENAVEQVKRSEEALRKSEEEAREKGGKSSTNATKPKNRASEERTESGSSKEEVRDPLFAPVFRKDERAEAPTAASNRKENAPASLKSLLETPDEPFVPFDVKAKTIPEGFKGHNLVRAIDAILKFSEVDGGELGFASDDVKLAFVVPCMARKVSGVDCLEVDYSPGRKTALLWKKDFGDEGWNSINPVPYFHSEAYQMHKTLPFTFAHVDNGKFSLYGFTVNATGARASKLYKNGATFMWNVCKLPVEKARELTEDGCVVCVMSLKKPNASTPIAVYRSAYKLYPKSVRHQRDLILMSDDAEFWICNSRTGEIFAKFSAAETLNGKVKEYGDVEPGSVAEPNASRKSGSEKVDKRADVGDASNKSTRATSNKRAASTSAVLQGYAPTFCRAFHTLRADCEVGS